MKRINKKISTALIAGATMVLVSGCGGGSSASIPEENNQPLSANDAKNAMALNAMAYRVLVPVYTAIRNGEITIDGGQTTTIYGQCDDGTFDRNVTGSGDNTTVTFTFNQCKTTQPNTDFQNPMIAECGVMALQVLRYQESAPTATTASVPAYYAIINGKVTCSINGNEGSADFDNYVVHAYNSTLQDPDGDNEWSYNMHAYLKKEPYAQTSGSIDDAKYTLALDGVIEGKKWEGPADGSGTLVDHEKWYMENFELVADHQGLQGDSLKTSGKLSYEGIVREGDTANNGIKLFVGFDNLTYAFTPMESSSEDVNVSVSGKVNASCHPYYAVYSTPVTLEDYAAVRDAEGDRMASAGTMTVAVEGKEGTATAEFEESGSNAAFVMTVDDNSTTYESWRAVIDGSSCAGLQEIIDRYLPI